MTPDESIDFIGDTAGKVCAEYNLPASVCIAQAILESGWGRYCIGSTTTLVVNGMAGVTMYGSRPQNMRMVSM